MRNKLCAALLVGVALGCAAQKASRGDEAPPPEFAQVLTNYERAWQAKDAHALAELFAEDGFVLPNGAAPVRGRSAIEAHYQGSGGPLALRALHWAREGSVGYIIGGYTGQRGKPDEGKFTLTLRKDADGVWRIVSDMDSMNSRPR